MRFIRRNVVFLSVLAVVLLAGILVVHQILSNQSAHADLREDFILLHERNETKAAERLYQLLVQELPTLSTRALIDDLLRTNMLVDEKSKNPDDLLWKLQVGLKNELQRRSKQRFARALEQGSSL